MTPREQIRKLLGLPKEKKPTDDTMPSVVMNNIPIPMDLLMEILIRQQSQIYTELGNLNGRMAVGEGLAGELMEQLEHVHEDTVTLQQNLQAIASHPVDKVDAEDPQPTAEDVEKRKRNLVN